ncbi:phage tail sheath family protein [Enterobacter sp. ECC-175]|uniref:phage tail sheath family protein n=1 Tax=unclassified Enterobacter TaxID=2608935 RepID=UPI0015EB7B75|nr:phage tail sheath family protein [Enterobacter sp. RIT 418]
MSTNALAPGVYVEEVDGLSLSVGRAATAVPVLVVGKSDKEPWWPHYQKPLLIPSFADYLRYVKGENSAAKTRYSRTGAQRSSINKHHAGPANWPMLANSETVPGMDIEWHRHFAPALKAYFDNGGGYCYVCPWDQLDMVLDMNDVTLLVQAGQKEAAAEILRLCEPGSGLFGLLDGPNEEGGFNEESLSEHLSTLSPSDCVSIYYPWLKADWNLNDKDGMPYPMDKIHPVAPSAAVAGVICSVDRQLGPWKAPANVALKGGLRPAVKIGDKSQAKFTDPSKTTISVNMLREFTGRGTQVWGARTMTISGNAWAYIPVRRTFDMAERDIKSAMESVLFEPNGPATWEVVRAAIDNYLHNLWQQGALVGSTPSTGYFVQVGKGVSMSQSDIDNGILRIRIGLAVVRPAEFIILEFSQQLANGS